MRVRPKYLRTNKDKIEEIVKKMLPLFSDEDLQVLILAQPRYPINGHLNTAYHRILTNLDDQTQIKEAAATLFATLDEHFVHARPGNPLDIKVRKTAAILGELSFYCPTFRPDYMPGLYPQEIIEEFEKGQKIAFAENQGSKLGLYGTPLLGAGALVAFLASAPISVVVLLGVLAVASPYAGEFFGRKGPGLFNNHNPAPAPAPAPAPVNYGAIPPAFSGTAHRL